MECVRVQVESVQSPITEQTADIIRYIAFATAAMLLFDIIFITFILFHYLIRLKILGKYMLAFYALASTCVLCEIVEMGFRIQCMTTFNEDNFGEGAPDYKPFNTETAI